MAYQKDEKTIAADIPIEVFQDFESQRKQRGQVKKTAVSAAIRLWVSLPEEIQARLLNKSLPETAFIELINQIVDDRIEAGRKVGRALRQGQKQKPGQKG